MKYAKYFYIVLLVVIASFSIGCSNDIAFSNAGAVLKSAGTNNTNGGESTTPPGTIPVTSVTNGDEANTVSEAYPCGKEHDDDNDKYLGEDDDKDDAAEVQRNYQVSCTAGTKKVLVCHVPPGNPANEHDICVSVRSFPAREAAGTAEGLDYFGPCKGQPQPEPSPTPSPTNVL